MKILALEFSSVQRSVAVVKALALTGPAGCPTTGLEYEMVESGGAATQALSMIDDALRGAQCEREQIECLAVGLGPGSYTGIRVAISLAQGWSLARGIKVLGLSSVDCLAAQAQADGLRGKVSIIIDAQRGEFYLGRYELSDHGWRELAPLRLASPAEVQATRAGDLLLGPKATSLDPAARLVYPRAATLGRLATQRSDFISPEQLQPIYLRPVSFVKAPPPSFRE